MLVLVFTFLNFLVVFVSAQCPPGLTPLFSQNNFNQPITCNPHDAGSCYSNSNRLGTVCQYASQYSNYICCYSANSQCGSNSSPQLTSNGQLVSCAQNSQCSCGFSCNNGICCPSSTPTSCQTGGSTPCLTGQVLVNGQCLNTVSIGSSCQNNQQCTCGSFCVNAICQCQNGQEKIQGRCQMRNPGMGLCPDETTPYNQQCVTLASPSQSCFVNNQCIDNSFCNNGFCTCNSNLNLVFGYCVPMPTGNCQNTQTLINNQCVLFSIVGESCLANSQCVGGATCISNTCRCPSGSTAMYGYCVRTSGSQGCSSVGCSVNQVSINGQCYNTVNTGGTCIFTQQCLNGGTCLNSICTTTNTNCNINCGTNQVCISNQCYQFVPIGSRCTFNQQCQQSNSQCLNGICQCPQGSQIVNGMCSGGSTVNFCSAGQTVQLDNTGQPINCLVSTCPSNSFCQYSQAGQRYVCCRGASGKK